MNLRAVFPSITLISIFFQYQAVLGIGFHSSKEKNREQQNSVKQRPIQECRVFERESRYTGGIDLSG